MKNWTRDRLPVRALASLLVMAGAAVPPKADIVDLRTAVIALTNALEFEIGSAGNQAPGSNEEVPCPGAVPDGTEDVYDFGLDGVPDYAQMALVEALYRAQDPQARDAINHMATALKTKVIVVPSGSFRGTELEGFEFLVNFLRLTLPDLLETVINTLGLLELPEGVGETRAERALLFNQAIDAITLWGSVDNPANMYNTVCMEVTVGVIFSILTTLYDNERANLNGRVGGQAPLGDGTTVYERWREAALSRGIPSVTTKTLATDDPVFLAAVDDFVAAVFAVIPGDINGDGAANAIDVQLVINAALGLAVPQLVRPDVNNDGAVDALDVQMVINGVLGSR